MKGVITWFIDNKVATNLFMWILIIGGLSALPRIHQEEFPNMDINAISISVVHPGASPIDVENAICMRIEEAIDGEIGIKHIDSTASEGICTVMAELEKSADKDKVLDHIKSKVDGIDSFPDEIENPVVAEVQVITNVLQVALSGDADERTLKELAERMREDLLEFDGVSQVTLMYVRPYEISIEVSEQSLRRFGLTLQQVGQSIQNNSYDLPGGAIKTEDGEILLRTATKAKNGRDLERIVILTRPDGSNVLLSDIATVIDGFKDTDLRASFNGEPAAVVVVKRVGHEDVLDIASKVKSYVAAAEQTLPEGITQTIWLDESQDLVDRLDVLSNNAISGLCLVLLVLALFLKLRLALWVAVGIPISLMGTVMLFPLLGISISTLSVMGVILVLGILVDDAIVVGERVHAHQQMGKTPRQAAIDGTYEVSVPVIFGVLTTMAAFMPIMFVPTNMGPFFAGIGIASLLTLFFSVIESQLILPMHLAHSSEREKKGLAIGRWWSNVQDGFASWLDGVANNHYQPLLAKALEWRYFTASIAVAIVIIILSMMASGRIVFQFFPSVDGTRINAMLTMPEGTPVETTEKAVLQLQRGAKLLQAELDADLEPGEDSKVTHVMASIGAHFEKNSMSLDTAGGSNIAEVAIELNLPPNYSGTPPAVFALRWRELTGPVADAVELTFDVSAFSAGMPIDLQVRGSSMEEIKQATAILRTAISSYDGVYDVSDTFRGGKQEVKLTLLPEARNLGLTAADLAMQVRHAFYGFEVQRIQRGREDIKVMVRYPENERVSLGDLEEMRIRTKDGIEVPFGSVAKVELGVGYAAINREDGQRVIRVKANLDRTVTTPENVLASLNKTTLLEIKERFPGVSFAVAGEAEESMEAMGAMGRMALMAMLIIYALLAIPLQSYLQPLVIMSVIPFGAMGAIIGHYIMGWDLIFFSLLGIMALSGVVVNSSLVLVDYINRQVRTGTPIEEAVLTAGSTRFRPIVLTSATTFVGLVPLISTSSLATMIFVPMAISLSFGVLFATAITLFLVPCLYLMLDDALQAQKQWRGGARKKLKSALGINQS